MPAQNVMEGCAHVRGVQRLVTMFDDPRDFVPPLRHVLSLAGLDLVHAFDVRRYNDAVAAHPVLGPLDDFDRDDGALALLLGNSRALWQPFLRAYDEQPVLQESTDPIDRYVEDVVNAAITRVHVESRVSFAHEREVRRISMVHAAQASGFAVLSPAQLAVHPVLGPWFGLRAVVVLDAAPPAHAPLEGPCDACTKPCVPAFEQAMASFRDEGSIRERWREWLSVRDACPVGREHRYDDEQIRYHYTKDRTRLPRRALPQARHEA